MTRKQIDNLGISEAINIYLKAGYKITFDTKDENIKAIARKILREQKKEH